MTSTFLANPSSVKHSSGQHGRTLAETLSQIYLTVHPANIRILQIQTQQGLQKSSENSVCSRLSAEVYECIQQSTEVKFKRLMNCTASLPAMI